MIIIDGGLTFTKIADTGTDSTADGYTSVTLSGPGATLTLPNNAQAGDFAILLDMAVNTTAAFPAPITPTDWSSIAISGGATTSGGAGARMAISLGVLTSSAIGTTITGMNGAGFNRKILLTLRPSRPIQSVTAGGWTVRLDSGVPGSILVPSAAAATPGAAVVVIGLAATAGVGDVIPFTWTPAADAVNSTTLASRAGYAVYPTDSTPLDYTIEMEDEGGMNGLAAGYFVFT